jgi:hypothetical protein
MSPTSSHLITSDSDSRIDRSYRGHSTRSALVGAAAALALIGAGAYSDAQISPARATRSGSLYEQVLTPRELPGFSVEADPATVTGASDWAAGERPASRPGETARLTGLGFEAGMFEPLVRRSPGETHATSTVERFRTVAGARAELRYQWRRLAGRGSRDFAVVGIPGARGVSTTTGHSTRLAVVFTSGRDYYLVTTVSEDPGRVTGTQLAAAACAQYLKVNGCTTDAAARPPLV